MLDRPSSFECDSELVTRFQAGRKSASIDLVRAHSPWVLAIVTRWLADNLAEIPREVSMDEVDDLTRFVLKEVQSGRGSIDDAAEILQSM